MPDGGPTRYEWDSHIQRSENLELRVDAIESKLDRYLGVAVATPWVLTVVLTALLIAERADLLP